MMTFFHYDSRSSDTTPDEYRNVYSDLGSMSVCVCIGLIIEPCADKALDPRVMGPSQVV